MAKFAFNIYETQKFQIIIDAIDVADARKQIREATLKDSLDGFEQRFVSSNEQWDTIELLQLDTTVICPVCEEATTQEDLDQWQMCHDCDNQLCPECSQLQCECGVAN